MWYWLAALSLVAFGLLGALSIGMPFLVVGLVLLVLGPVRRRPMIFWPVLLAVVGGLLAYLSLVPMFCTITSELGASDGGTVCRNLIGQRFEGGEGFRPSFEPARHAALVVGVVAGLGTVVLQRLARRGR